MSNMTKEMKMHLDHLFFLKLLSGISSHPKRLYSVQLQTLCVQLSEEKLTLNSVVDLISTEEEAITNTRGENLNQIAFSSSVTLKNKPFTCHNCGSPDHFFRNCSRPLRANLKAITSSSYVAKKKNKSFNKNKLKGKSAQKEVVSLSNSSDENENAHQAGSVFVIGEASNAVVTGKQNKNVSIFDSGASDPFFITTSPLSRYVALCNVFVKVANGDLIPVTHVGEARIAVFIDGIQKELVYKKAFVVPSLDQNLLSMSKLWDNGYTFSSDIKTRSLLITNATTGELICRAPERKGVFPLCRETWNGATAYSVKKVLSSNSLLWHQRFGHLHHQGLQRLARKEMVKGLTPEMVSASFECEACIQGKHPKTPYFPSNSSTKEVGELVHSDVCGPIQVRSRYGKWYIVSFIDDYSGMVRSYAIRTKDQVTLCFEKYVNWLKRETGKTIKRIRSDRGGEYVGSEFQKLLTKEGISQQLTVGYAPPQNGKAERWNRTLVDGICTVLIDSGLPLSFWEDAMEYIVITHNRCPTASKKKVPFHLFYKRKPNITFLRRFGTKAYAHIGKSHKKKLDPINTPVIVLGYQEGVKGYKILDLKTGRVTQSDQVVFVENNRVSLTDVNEIPAPSGQPIVIISKEVELGPENNEHRTVENRVAEPEEHRQVEERRNEVILQRRGPLQAMFPPNLINELQNRIHNIPQNNGNRVQQIEQQLENNNNEDHLENNQENVQRRRYPRRINAGINTRITSEEYDVRGMVNLQGQFIDLFGCNVELIEEMPQTFSEAMNSDDASAWIAAMEYELETINQYNTATLVELPEGKKPLTTRWVFNKRAKPDSSLQHKARLCVRGFEQ